MRDWTAEEIAFMHDAMTRSDYYEKIAARICLYLPPQAHLCDAGCGLGQLGMMLSSRCRQVTCVDSSPGAIADLRKNAPPGLCILCGDISSLAPQTPYDAMVFCLFGRTAQALAIADAQCRGKVFLVKRDYTHHRFSAGHVPLGVYTAAQTRQELEHWGIPFLEESFSAEFGQPFRSLDDAERFFAIYNRSAGQRFSREEIARRLVPGEGGEFPYYLPNERHLCLFVMDTEDIAGRSQQWKNGRF